MRSGWVWGVFYCQEKLATILFGRVPMERVEPLASSGRYR